MSIFLTWYVIEKCFKGLFMHEKLFNSRNIGVFLMKFFFYPNSKIFLYNKKNFLHILSDRSQPFTFRNISVFVRLHVESKAIIC